MGRKAPILLGPAARFPTAAHLLPGSRQSRRLAPQRKASKSCPGMKDGPGQPRSPRQTQAWPGAWEGAELIPGENTVKSTAPGGGPGANPRLPCAFPSHTPAGGGGKGQEGAGTGIQAPVSSARPSVGPFISLPYLFLASPHFMNGLSKAKSLAQGHPAVSWQSWNLNLGLNINSFIQVTPKFAEPLYARALQPSLFLTATIRQKGKLRPKSRR